MRMMRALWAYRGFILGSVRREFQSKYSNSLLGAAWTVINPLAMIVVYTVIFSQVMQAKLPGVDSKFAYSIYLCAGVLTWTFFAEVVTQSITCALYFLRGILLGLRNNACTLDFAFGTGLLDNLSSVFFSVRHADMQVRFGRCLDQTDASLRLCQVSFAFFGRSQPVSNFLASLINCLCQGRPDELHRDPTQDKEHDHLEKDRRVQIHGRFPITAMPHRQNVSQG